MSTNSATSVNTVRDLQRVLEDHLVDPSEFFTEGCCWAYAYALGVKLSATAFMIEKPSHVWIEQNGRAYDGRCGGVPRQELLRRFFDGPYVPEKAVAEAARLAGASQPLALSELERFYNSQKVLGKKRYNIAWDLALSFAEQVFAVQLAATAFRAAIERCDRTGLSIAFQYFPRGSCGDTAILLGSYLQDQKLGKFDYVSGERGNVAEGSWQSHAWIEQGNLFLDITADQFRETDESVLIGSAMQRHRLFSVKSRNPADFRAYAEHKRAELEAAYHHILASRPAPAGSTGARPSC